MRRFVRGLQGMSPGVQGHLFITSAEPEMECSIAEASPVALLDDREALNVAIQQTAKNLKASRFPSRLALRFFIRQA